MFAHRNGLCDPLRPRLHGYWKPQTDRFRLPATVQLWRILRWVMMDVANCASINVDSG